MLELVAAALPLAVLAATPLLLAVEGELVVQRSGMINLGLEGMLLAAAMAAALGARAGGVAAGFAAGIAGAAAVAAIFGAFAIALRADQIVTGAAINLLALGATSFVYRELQERGLFLLDLPNAAHRLAVPFAWVVAPVLLAIFLWNTRTGLRLRACGENPEAVAASGASVALHRWLALAFEAVLAGLGGAYLAMALSAGFAENMTAGRGFIALAIVIFGRWKVRGIVLGTAVFGLAAALQYAMQAAGSRVPYHLLLALPYVVTLLILAGVTGRVRAPESLGRS